MEWIRNALVEGVDYGRIHSVGKNKCQYAAQGKARECPDQNHWSKPSLFKPGAEKICGMLGVTVHYPSLRDYEQAALQGANLHAIIIRCELQDAVGRAIADGVGARTLQQDNGDLNKSLKMAEKSAHIDATLRMAGLSEVFTQDLEDLQVKEKAQDTQGKDQANKPIQPKPEASTRTQHINSMQHKRLEARIKGLRLDRERVKGWVKRKWGVEHLNEISFDQYKELDCKLEQFAEQAWNEIKDKPISEKQTKELTDFINERGLEMETVKAWAGIKAPCEITKGQLDAVWDYVHKLARRKAQEEWDALSDEEKARRNQAMEAAYMRSEEAGRRCATAGT